MVIADNVRTVGAVKEESSSHFPRIFGYRVTENIQAYPHYVYRYCVHQPLVNTLILSPSLHLVDLHLFLLSARIFKNNNSRLHFYNKTTTVHRNSITDFCQLSVSDEVQQNLTELMPGPINYLNDIYIWSAT